MTDWLIKMLFSTTLLFGFVLILRQPVSRLFGPHAAYALWMAPAIRAILPPLSIAPRIIPHNIMSAAPHYIVVARSPFHSDASRIGGAIWLGGAALFLAWHWISHHRFMVKARAHCHHLHIAGVTADVLISSCVRGPMAAGLLCPVVLVPNEFTDVFDTAEQRLALLHEELHHRRGDIWANACALVLVSMHWFNPLAYAALRAFRRDMEASCDASVLHRAGPDAASLYAKTILRCAAPSAPRSLCTLTSTDHLKGRLMMLKIRHGRARRAAGLLLASAIATSSVATASTAEENATIGAQAIKEKIILRNGHGPKRLVKGDGKPPAFTCPGEKFEIGTNDSAKSDEQLKLVICAPKGESLAAALEKAQRDIQRRDEIPADRKAELLSQLRSKIAELRAKG